MSLYALQYTYRDLLVSEKNTEIARETIHFLLSTDVYDDFFLGEANEKIDHLKELGEIKLYNKLKGFPN